MSDINADKIYVLNCLRNNEDIVDQVNPIIFEDEDFCKQMLREEIYDDENILNLIPQKFYDSKDFLLDIINIKPFVVYRSSLKNNLSLVELMVEKNSKVFNYLPENIRELEDVILKAKYATEEWDIFLEGLTKKTLSDRDFVIENLLDVYGIVSAIDDSIKDKELIIKAANKNTVYYGEITGEKNIELDLDLMIALCESYVKNVKVFPEEVINNPILMADLVSNIEEVIYYIPEMYENIDFVKQLGDKVKIFNIDILNTIYNSIQREKDLTTSIENVDLNKSQRNRMKI